MDATPVRPPNGFVHSGTRMLQRNLFRSRARAKLSESHRSSPHAHKSCFWNYAASNRDLLPYGVLLTVGSSRFLLTLLAIGMLMSGYLQLKVSAEHEATVRFAVAP